MTAEHYKDQFMTMLREIYPKALPEGVNAVEFCLANKTYTIQFDPADYQAHKAQQKTFKERLTPKDRKLLKALHITSK